MSESHLGALQLSAERIATLVDFYESYARLALQRGEEAGTDAALEAALVDEASALRTAGQWAMILDSGRAADLLVRSGLRWHRLGHGFGTYLLAALRPSALPTEELRNRQLLLLAMLTGQPIAAPAIPAPLRHPQQQAYLLLASADRSQLSIAVRQAATQSPHRLGVVPIGALGMPLRVYWDAALYLLAEDASLAAKGAEPDGLGVVCGHLEAMAVAYTTTINSAMANEYLWFSGASPVDVGDIDISALAALAARRFGVERVTQALYERAERHPPLTRVPLELAAETAAHVMRRIVPPDDLVDTEWP